MAWKSFAAIGDSLPCSSSRACSRGPLALKLFSADVLENSLLDPENHRMFLGELLFKLLRRASIHTYGDQHVDAWELLLPRKLFSMWRGYLASNPLEERDFYSITAEARVGRSLQRLRLRALSNANVFCAACNPQLAILYALCEWRANECPEVREALKSKVCPRPSLGRARAGPISSCLLSLCKQGRPTTGAMLWPGGGLGGSP